MRPQHGHSQDRSDPAVFSKTAYPRSPVTSTLAGPSGRVSTLHVAVTEPSPGRAVPRPGWAQSYQDGDVATSPPCPHSTSPRPHFIGRVGTDVGGARCPSGRIVSSISRWTGRGGNQGDALWVRSVNQHDMVCIINSYLLIYLK